MNVPNNSDPKRRKPDIVLQEADPLEDARLRQAVEGFLSRLIGLAESGSTTATASAPLASLDTSSIRLLLKEFTKSLERNQPASHVPSSTAQDIPNTTTRTTNTSSGYHEPTYSSRASGGQEQQPQISQQQAAPMMQAAAPVLQQVDNRWETTLAENRILKEQLDHAIQQSTIDVQAAQTIIQGIRQLVKELKAELELGERSTTTSTTKKSRGVQEQQQQEQQQQQMREMEEQLRAKEQEMRDLYEELDNSRSMLAKYKETHNMLENKMQKAGDEIQALRTFLDQIENNVVAANTNNVSAVAAVAAATAAGVGVGPSGTANFLPSPPGHQQEKSTKGGAFLVEPLIESLPTQQPQPQQQQYQPQLQQQSQYSTTVETVVSEEDPEEWVGNRGMMFPSFPAGAAAAMPSTPPRGGMAYLQYQMAEAVQSAKHSALTAQQAAVPRHETTNYSYPLYPNSSGLYRNRGAAPSLSGTKQFPLQPRHIR